MTAKELIGLIPEGIFEELSVEAKVDAQVKKLSGGNFGESLPGFHCKVYQVKLWVRAK